MTKKLSPKIYVAGHRGMVGSAIIRQLKSKGYSNIVVKNRDELDLTDQRAVNEFFNIEQPAQVYLAAAKVGGVYANNTYPADFIYQNMMMEANVIHAAWKSRVHKLLFLGSSCIYPKFAKQPMSEDMLLTDTLEATNEPYAIAKIAGIKLCESYNRQYGVDYRSVMPTNLYGPGDNYHPKNSHVIPALIRKFHEAKESQSNKVLVWGSGEPRREFLYVDDMADACVFVMNLPKAILDKHVSPMQSHINVGFGEDVTIYDLAIAVSRAVGYHCEVKFDATMPDGAPRKWINSQKLNMLGWKPKMNLNNGLILAYQDFISKIITGKVCQKGIG